MDKTMGPDRTAEFNITPTAPEAVAPRAPSLGQRALRRVFNHLPALGGLGAFLMFPAAGRAETQFTSDTPNQPEISAQTAPQEAVAGAVDIVEPVIESAPAAEVPSIEIKPNYMSPDGRFSVTDFPGIEKVFRLDPNKEGLVDQELTSLKDKIQFIPDDQLTPDMIKPGLLSRDGAIGIDSCLELDTSSAAFSSEDCNNWMLLMPVYKDGVLELHYKVTQTNRPPTTETWTRLARNFNNSYLPTYLALRENPDANSALALQLRPKFRGLAALTVQDPTVAGNPQENS